MSKIPKSALRESWESVYDKSLALAFLIEEHCRKTGEQFDAMVIVPRGSYYPANIVSRELGFDSVDMLHASIGSYFDGTTKRKASFELGQMPTDEEINGKNLIVLEEVCDTGRTLEFLTKRLKEQGAKLVRSGCLHYKPGGSQTGYKPDWSVAETDNWIVYPWEKHELQGKKSIVHRKT